MFNQILIIILCTPLIYFSLTMYKKKNNLKISNGKLLFIAIVPCGWLVYILFNATPKAPIGIHNDMHLNCRCALTKNNKLIKCSEHV